MSQPISSEKYFNSEVPKDRPSHLPVLILRKQTNQKTFNINQNCVYIYICIITPWIYEHLNLKSQSFRHIIIASQKVMLSLSVTRLWDQSTSKQSRKSWQFPGIFVCCWTMSFFVAHLHETTRNHLPTVPS